MSFEPAIREGGCRCGRLRFEISAPPLLTMACHCTGCQRMTGSAFSLSVAIPSSGFAIISGEPVIGGLKGVPEHFFCPQCFSWAFTRPPKFVGDFVNVRQTLIDEVDPRPPFIETWTSEKLDWASTSAVHSFSGFPPPESFPGLLAEFAARDGRQSAAPI